MILVLQAVAFLRFVLVMVERCFLVWSLSRKKFFSGRLAQKIVTLCFSDSFWENNSAITWHLYWYKKYSFKKQLFFFLQAPMKNTLNVKTQRLLLCSLRWQAVLSTQLQISQWTNRRQWLVSTEFRRILFHISTSGRYPETIKFLIQRKNCCQEWKIVSYCARSSIF